MNTEAMDTETAKVGWWTTIWTFLIDLLYPDRDVRLQLFNEVDWGVFLSRLRREDYNNVESLLNGLRVVDKEVPLAVVAVGSTLNNQTAYYRDIDLYLLPIHEHNIGLAEGVFASFIRGLEQTRKIGRTDEPEELSPCYEATRCWYLDFAENTAPIHLMLLTDKDPSSARSRLTLDGFLKHEGERPESRLYEKFSALVLSEYTDQ